MQSSIFDVTFRQIQYFLTVAETGNITQAAERLYIAQPVLSKRMMALEEQIGLPLFSRDGRAIHLTQTGCYLYDEWKNLLHQYEQELSEASRLQRFAVDHFSIGCFPVLHTAAFLYPYLTALMNRSPNLDVKVKRENRVLLLEDLQKKELDMAFLLETDMPEGQDCFEYRSVGQCRLVAAVHEDSALARKTELCFSDLDNQNLVFSLPEKSPQKRSGIHQICVDHQVRAASVRYVNSDVTAMIQVELGRGVTLGPDLFYPDYNPKVCLVPVQNRPIRIIAIWNKRDIPEIKSLIHGFLNDMDSE